MRKRILRTLAVLLAVALLFFAPAGLSMLSKKGEDIPFRTVKNSGASSPGAYPGYASAEAFAQDMEKAAENSRYALYIHAELGAVALYDKDQGRYFLSNPFDVEAGNDEEAEKDKQRSQVLLTYYNDKNELIALNSFRHCIAKSQAVIEKTDGGARVDMTLGQVGESYLLPEQISSDALETLLAKLDPMDAEMLRTSYKTLTLKGVDGDTAALLKREYPYLEKGDLCELYPISAREKKNYSAALELAGYTEEEKKEEYRKIGYAGGEAQPAFTLTVTYALDEEGLTAGISLDEAAYDASHFQLSDITLLPYFGCGTLSDASGEIFLPDGSGAVLRYNADGSKKLSSLTLQVYGQDAAEVSGGANDAPLPAARLPVYGNAGAQGSFLAVIERGESVCRITADSGSSRPTAYATAKYRYDETFFYNDKDFSKNVTAYADVHNRGEVRVRYLPIRDGGGYADMALAYRRYLTERGVLKPRESEPRLILQMLGAGRDKDGLFALTSFEDASGVIKELKGLGVDRLALRYLGWTAGGLHNRYVKKAAPESRLGGAAGYRDLYRSAGESGVELFMDMDLAYVRDTGWFDGYSVNRDTCRSLRGKLTGIYRYNFGDSAADPGSLSYGVSPARLLGDAAGLSRSFGGKLPGARISAGSLGTALNASFRRGAEITRPEAQEMLAETLETLAGGDRLMLEGGNAYTLPWCGSVVNLTVTSSGYASTDYDVPFMQIVLSGSVEFSAPPLNEGENVRGNLLKAVETGASISYITAVQNQNRLKGSAESGYYSVDYDTLKPGMAAIYKEFAEAADRTRGSAVADHERLAPGVSRTAFENGAAVVVNYNEAPFAYEGRTVPPMSYRFE